MPQAQKAMQWEAATIAHCLASMAHVQATMANTSVRTMTHALACSYMDPSFSHNALALTRSTMVHTFTTIAYGLT